jgi:hypothetical protein
MQVKFGGAWWGNLSNLKWVQIGGQWLGIPWSSHSNLSDCIGPAPCEAAANSPLQRCRMQSPPELVKAVHKGCNHSSLHTFKTRLCSGLLAATDCCNFKFIRKTSKSVFQQFLALKLTSKGWLVCTSTGRYLHSSYSVVPRGVFFFFPVFPRQHELDEQRTIGNHSGQ